MKQFSADYSVSILNKDDFNRKIKELQTHEFKAHEKSRMSTDVDLKILVESARNGDWIGIFTGDHPYEEVTGFYYCPDPGTILVVSSGTAFIFKVENPEDYKVLSLAPVVLVKGFPDQNILLAADFCNLVAISELGVLWESDRLALDDLTIEKVDESYIYATGFFGHSHDVPFKIDRNTGIDKDGTYSFLE